MPFNPQATYIGGQLLAQGIQSAGQSIGGAIQQYQNILDEATKSDAQMNYLSQQVDPVTGKPIIDPKTLQNYMQHSARQRAFVAGGVNAGMTLAQHLQRYALENRETLARTNELTAHAAYLQNQAAQGAGPGGSPGKGKIWSDELGGWATPAQADAARRRTTQGYLMQSYGLTPDQIFDSKQHEAGTVTIDPTTGAKKFTNDPNGDQIRIGGATGVMMPKAEHEIYKRQLQHQGFQAGGAAGGGAGGAQSPARQQAIAALQQAGHPVTEANINYTMQQLNRAPGGAAAAQGAPTTGAPAGGKTWRQGTNAQGQPYWFTDEGEYSDTKPGG
jgi:hypothetical protein